MTAQKVTIKTPKGWVDIVMKETIIPIVFMAFFPSFSVCITYLAVVKKSNVSDTLSRGLKSFWSEAWRTAGVGNREAWSLVLGLAVWSAFSVLCLGGRRYYGPPTYNGFRPEYRNSGFRYYFLTVVPVVVALGWPGLVPAWQIYTNMVALAGALVLFGLCVSVLVYIKSLITLSPGEHGSSGNPIFDIYWGRELYPRLGSRFDVKMWTNCRFGLMAWQLVVLICWKAQIDHSGWNWSMAATSLLQTVYICKFYWWEDGYMKSIDIILDRAGYYICWGCTCLVPTFYTLTSLYMVENCPNMNVGEFSVFFVLGLATIALNYMTDRQRQLARATDGRCAIWGQQAQVIRAKYTDSTGKIRESLLLASGFWGLSRHMNYIFEIASYFMWSAPSLFHSFVPFYCVIFLTLLLVHRSFRDENKCRAKYGRFWEEYCKISRYQIVPGIF